MLLEVKNLCVNYGHIEAIRDISFGVEEGKIASVDAPLSTWFADFKTGEKAKVTLRHVLTHPTARLALEGLTAAALLLLAARVLLSAAA